MPRSSLPQLFSLKEFLEPAFYRDVFIEMLISSLLLLFITFSLTSLDADVYRPSTTHIGLTVGFVIYVLIEGNGHLSGAHMNPVVSFAFCLDGRITCVRAFLYTLAQCIGGTLGSGIVYGLSPPDTREAFRPFTPAPSIGVPQGLIIEMVFTFNLIYTAISTSDKSTHNVMLPSLPTAFCVGTAIMAAGTWTGACLNPIVALGPAVISKNFAYHWIYWVADYTGALMAVLVYKLYILVNKSQTDPDTSHSKRPEEEMALKSERMKEEISDLLDKLINIASRRENNSNRFRGSKQQLSDAKPTESGS